jgi:hypothetical protein
VKLCLPFLAAKELLNFSFFPVPSVEGGGWDPAGIDLTQT